MKEGLFQFSATCRSWPLTYLLKLGFILDIPRLICTVRRTNRIPHPLYFAAMSREPTIQLKMQRKVPLAKIISNSPSLQVSYPFTLGIFRAILTNSPTFIVAGSFCTVIYALGAHNEYAKSQLAIKQLRAITGDELARMRSDKDDEIAMLRRLWLPGFVKRRRRFVLTGAK
jgi:hypothetical protein